MTVYLDVVFLVNGAINALLLAASGRLGGGKLILWRIVAAAVFGGVYGALSLLPEVRFLNYLVPKILAAAVMVLVCFGFSIKTIRLGVLFFAVSFCFAGAVYIAAKLFSGDVLLIDGGIFYPVSAFGLMLVAAAAYAAARLAFSGLCIHTTAQIVPFTLTLGQHSVPVRALLDTGNTLRDPLTNEAVAVVNWSVLAELLPYLHFIKADFEQPTVLLGKLHTLAPQLKTRLIPYKTVGVQTGLLLAARLQSGNRQILTAFSPNAVSDGGNYEALIGEAV